jgi:hypothetical protein
MSRENTENLQEIEEIDEQDEWEEGDYGFIINSEGELKTMMFPEDLMEDPPVEIKKILKIFGIKNIHQIESKTIH